MKPLPTFEQFLNQKSVNEDANLSQEEIDKMKDLYKIMYKDYSKGHDSRDAQRLSFIELRTNFKHNFSDDELRQILKLKTPEIDTDEYEYRINNARDRIDGLKKRLKEKEEKYKNGSPEEKQVLQLYKNAKALSIQSEESMIKAYQLKLNGDDEGYNKNLNSVVTPLRMKAMDAWEQMNKKIDQLGLSQHNWN